MDLTELEYWNKGFERIVFLENGERISYRYVFYYHECMNRLTIKSIRKHYRKERFSKRGYIELIHKKVRNYNKYYKKLKSE